MTPLLVLPCPLLGSASAWPQRSQALPLARGTVRPYARGHPSAPRADPGTGSGPRGEQRRSERDLEEEGRVTKGRRRHPEATGCACGALGASDRPSRSALAWSCVGRGGVAGAGAGETGCSPPVVASPEAPTTPSSKEWGADRQRGGDWGAGRCPAEGGRLACVPQLRPAWPAVLPVDGLPAAPPPRPADSRARPGSVRLGPALGRGPRRGRRRRAAGGPGAARRPGDPGRRPTPAPAGPPGGRGAPAPLAPPPSSPPEPAGRAADRPRGARRAPKPRRPRPAPEPPAGALTAAAAPPAAPTPLFDRDDDGAVVDNHGLGARPDAQPAGHEAKGPGPGGDGSGGGRHPPLGTERRPPGREAAPEVAPEKGDADPDVARVAPATDGHAEARPVPRLLPPAGVAVEVAGTPDVRRGVADPPAVLGLVALRLAPISASPPSFAGLSPPRPVWLWVWKTRSLTSQKPFTPGRPDRERFRQKLARTPPGSSREIVYLWSSLHCNCRPQC